MSRTPSSRGKPSNFPELEQVDPRQPIAALLKDLKQRGLLEHTLVVFCTEFGRMPRFQKGTFGRDHNARGFTCWFAGAGVKSAFSYGETDEFGFQAVDNVVTVHDFHATILHLLGLDHQRLTFYHNGIERRLTDVHGAVNSRGACVIAGNRHHDLPLNQQQIPLADASHGSMFLLWSGSL